MHTAKKTPQKQKKTTKKNKKNQQQASGMSPNTIGLKDNYVFVKTAVLIWNPP